MNESQQLTIRQNIHIMAMESKTTSKTSSLTALLLKAWRERWTDLQWGINIKTVLPRGVSGDVYNLADCILQQAVVGAGANQLVLSYLRHSLSAQLVSHAAVLQRLSKYNQFTKVFCVFSLLEFLEGMIAGVTCCGKNEETVLATSILSISCWLLSILLQIDGAVHMDLKQKTLSLFQTLMNDDFYVSMMCVAKYSDPELFAETNRKCVELSATLSETDELLKSVKKLENIEVTTLALPLSSENWPGSLIQYWLEVKLVGNPGASTTCLAAQLKLFQNLKGFDDSRLFAEIMRGSLLALYDVSQTSHESQWGAFAFLKVPHILLELAGKTDSQHIVTAVELMLQHSPLLDTMDANSSCSSLECLLGEFVKIRLMNEVQVKHLLEKRKAPPTLKLDTAPATAGIPKVIICAEPTLAGILKTLSTDYHKIQDALLGMLHQVLTGKSFELILAVATVKGQLKTLVARLIRFNECSKSGGDKSRAQLFDISFLMLVTIVQNYGARAVLDDDGDSLFEQWVRSCMVERQKPKAPEQLLRLGDSSTIEMLITQFNAGDNDFKATVKWQDVLFNMAGVMHEVLVAWEQGTLAPCDVKRILDAVRGRMCCLPLAAAAWLCAYMRTAPQENLLKPINMVQQLLTPPAAEEDSLRERWQLTCEIIRKMQRDVQLPLQTKSSHHLISRQPAIEQLHSVWTAAIQRGWLDHNAAKTLHCLLDTAGARWLVSATVQELVKLRYPDHLQRGVDLALAVFHVNIVSCTMELLSHIYQMLYNDMKAWQLEPQLLALAQLTSCCIYTAVDECLGEDSSSRDSREESAAKRPRLGDNVTVMQDVGGTCTTTTTTTTTTIEQLVSSLRKLLTIFEEIVREGYITQQTYFAFYLIKSLVEVRVNNGDVVLAAIPPALITDLLRTLPELFSYSVLIRLHDFTVHGRSNMAKDLCILRNYKLKNGSKENVSI